MDVQSSSSRREREQKRTLKTEPEHYFSMYKRGGKRKRGKRVVAAKKLRANILIVCLPASRLREVAALSSLCVLVPGSRTAHAARWWCEGKGCFALPGLRSPPLPWRQTPIRLRTRYFVISLCVCVCNNITHSYIHKRNKMFFGNNREKTERLLILSQSSVCLRRWKVIYHAVPLCASN